MHFTRPQIHLSVLFLLTLGVTIPALGQQHFELSTPNQKSTAVLDGRGLTITSQQGLRYEYVRQRAADSPDNLYEGYFSNQAQQYIRWPRTNRGAFLIRGANDVNWRRSQMQILPLRRPPQPRQFPNINLPGDPPPFGEVQVRQPPGAHQHPSRHCCPAVFDGPGGQLYSSYIAPQGQLMMAVGSGYDWQQRALPVDTKLVAGAPVAIASDGNARGNLPRIFTVNPKGHVIEIIKGRFVRAIVTDIPFVPGTHLKVMDTGISVNAFAVDQTGRLWMLDLDRGTHQMLDPQVRRYLPGSPVEVLAGRTSIGLYLVDSIGNLVRWTMRNNRWIGPEMMTEGLIAGSAVNGQLLIAPPGQPPTVFLAYVNRLGQFQLLTETSNGVRHEQVTSKRYPPGAPVAIRTDSRGTVHLSLVNLSGVLEEWVHDPQRGWLPRTIAEGFAVGTPVLYHSNGQGAPHAFAVDASGALFSGHFDRTWNGNLVSPRFPRGRRLVSRKVVPQNPLKPVTIFFDNRHTEDLILQVEEGNTPTGVEIKIPAGGSVAYQAPRSTGSVIEEVYLIPTPTGLVQRTEQIELPPGLGTSIMVYANRVTYKYIDNSKVKRPGQLPSFERKSAVSLGHFNLPPGNLLQDGSRIDVYLAAKSQRNPGAAVWFHPPRPQP